MFLKSLDIFGFKSFADRTHIDFADGITALLGPNGCGKSNVVDAIKWVLAENKAKNLRAQEKTDVIFNFFSRRAKLRSSYSSPIRRLIPFFPALAVRPAL